MSLNSPLQLLGNLSPNQFMSQYWQKKPLLIKDAISNYTCPLSPDELRHLATLDETESRLILSDGADDWDMETGPFEDFPGPKDDVWSLLVQSVNLHDETIQKLMQLFRFIPDARLDDVMISLANKGGGVGPHVDSYDVFLLQGRGKRQWRISEQEDLSIRPGLPCKILQNFTPEHSYILQAGDMLYLPPNVAHEGVALDDDCITISIGFRSPTLATLARGVLESAADATDNTHLAQEYYTDPNQPATQSPAIIPDALIEKSIQAVQQIAIDKNLAENFIGCWLSEPNQLSVFEGKDNLPDFTNLSGTFKLDPASKMLYKQNLFINGEIAPIKPSAFWQELANQQSICASAATNLSEQEQEYLLCCCEDGWIHLVE